jgi:hypothetical protein
MRTKFLFIFMLLFSAFFARAQHAAPANDTIMKGAIIEVIQSYKPQVKQAPKPEWVPQLPPADTTHPAFTYEVPQQTLFYTYSSLPLHPLALGANVEKSPFSNYIKAGGGNLSALFLDAGIGGIRGADYETDIHMHHLSQQGSIKYQQSALSGIEAEGILHGDNNDWHATIDGERNEYYYYGYDHSKYSFSSNNLQQVYTTVRGCVDMKNKGDSTDNISYHPSINASLYNAKFNTSETTLGFNAPFNYKLDNAVQAQLDLSGALTQYKVNSLATNNSYVELLPGINLNGAFSGHALFGLAIGKGSTFYFLPDILAAYKIPETPVTISGGYQSTLRQNTYEQLTTENPYLANVYTVMQTRRDEAFANIQAGIGDHLSLSGRVSWWSYKDLPTFLDTTAVVNPINPFYVVYDNVNALSLQLGARYVIAHTWSVGVSGDFYHFYNGTQLYVWHEPNVKIKGDLTFMPFPKLTVTAYIALLGGITAKDNGNNVVKLSTIADIGGNAECQIVSRLSAFVQLNNILNDKYQRWLGYQAYGLNIYGGVRLKF